MEADQHGGMCVLVLVREVVLRYCGSWGQSCRMQIAIWAVSGKAKGAPGAAPATAPTVDLFEIRENTHSHTSQYTTTLDTEHSTSHSQSSNGDRRRRCGGCVIRASRLRVQNDVLMFKSGAAEPDTQLSAELSTHRARHRAPETHTSTVAGAPPQRASGRGPSLH